MKMASARDEERKDNVNRYKEESRLEEEQEQHADKFLK